MCLHGAHVVIATRSLVPAHKRGPELQSERVDSGPHPPSCSLARSLASTREPRNDGDYCRFLIPDLFCLSARAVFEGFLFFFFFLFRICFSGSRCRRKVCCDLPLFSSFFFRSAAFFASRQPAGVFHIKALAAEPQCLHYVSLTAPLTPASPRNPHVVAGDAALSLPLCRLV